MRSNLARHACRARTGIFKDAIHCQSRSLCLRNRSSCVSSLHDCRGLNSRQPYSTNRFNDDTETKATDADKPPRASAHTGKGRPEETKASAEEEGTNAKPQSQTSSDSLGGAEQETVGVPHGKATDKQRSTVLAPESQDQNAIEAKKSQAWEIPSTGEPSDQSRSQPPHPKSQGLSWLSDSFRRVLRRQTNGVTIITARTPEGDPVGSTVSSFTSVSLDPKPFFSFNLLRWGKTFKSIMAHGSTFNIHMLDSTKEGIEMAEKFVGRSLVCSKDDLWKHVDWTGTDSEPPMLQGQEIPWVFTCKVSFAKNVADHAVIVAEVIDIRPKREIPQVELHGGFLTFRDGWYREPGLDFEDAMSRLTRLKRNEKLEILKIKEERRLAHARNQERVLESQRNRERRAEFEHRRRQESHERKQKNMMLKMAEHDFPAWEAKIRADEREKIRAEGWTVKQAGEEKEDQPKTEKSTAEGPTTPKPEAKKAKDDSPLMAPWRD